MKRLLGISLWLGTMAVSAQTINETSVYSEPAGATITVDGQRYFGSAAFLWPAGSKHTLSIEQVQAPRYAVETRMVFQSWSDSTGQFTSSLNTIVITADPAITFYKAKVTEQFALSLNYFNACGAPDPRTCPGWPGQIVINNVAYFVSQDIYLDAGSLVTMEADPAVGWIFLGWSPSPGQRNAGVPGDFYAEQPGPAISDLCRGESHYAADFSTGFSDSGRSHYPARSHFA